MQDLSPYITSTVAKLDPLCFSQISAENVLSDKTACVCTGGKVYHDHQCQSDLKHYLACDPLTRSKYCKNRRRGDEQAKMELAAATTSMGFLGPSARKILRNCSAPSVAGDGLRWAGRSSSLASISIRSDVPKSTAFYALQAKYAEQMTALEAQIAALKTQRNKEVDAVLKPEQLEQVNKKRAAAAERRKGRKKPAAPTSDAAPKK